MPNMRSPLQQTAGQPVEYATQADVRVPDAEIRGLREAMEAELGAQRESADARFGKVEAELRGLRESMEAELRAQRESMEAELRAQRESADVRFGKVEAELRAQREFMEAELRVQREFMKAELRAQRESTDARFEKVEGLLEGQQELIKVLLEGQVQQAARFDRQDARLDSLLKWGVGVMVGTMASFGGLVFAAVRLGGGGG